MVFVAMGVALAFLLAMDGILSQPAYPDDLDPSLVPYRPLPLKLLNSFGTCWRFDSDFDPSGCEQFITPKLFGALGLLVYNLFGWDVLPEDADAFEALAMSATGLSNFGDPS